MHDVIIVHVIIYKWGLTNHTINKWTNRHRKCKTTLGPAGHTWSLQLAGKTGIRWYDHQRCVCCEQLAQDLSSCHNEASKRMLITKVETSHPCSPSEQCQGWKEGDKLQARCLRPHTITEDLGKGVFRLCNPTTGRRVWMLAIWCHFARNQQWSPLNPSNNPLFKGYENSCW